MAEYNLRNYLYSHNGTYSNHFGRFLVDVLYISCYPGKYTHFIDSLVCSEMAKAI